MSFPNTGGATLALPSPTHAHQMDVTSAVRKLRRSISRSPSKFLSRTSSHGSETSQPQQASPQSPCRRFGATPQHHRLPSQSQSAPPAPLTTQASTTPTGSPLATPFRPNLKLSLRSTKSTRSLTPTRPLTRTRASPKSPLKRTLNSGSEAGSCLQSFAPSSSTHEFHDQENRGFGQRSPATRSSLDKPSRHSCHLDISGASQLFLRSLDTPSSLTPLPSSGTLKRSDATMNLDHPAQGSPVAKRRSLHGISTSQEIENLGIFGSTNTSAPAPAQSFEIHEDSGSEYELAGLSGTLQRDPFPSPTPGSNLPKRTSSLRKSTLQQRYGDKGSFGRRTGERHLAQMSPEPFSPAQNRPRLSTDQFVPPPAPRDSLFSQGTPLPNPSIHAIDNKRHPLSQFLTASSSGNSLKDEPYNFLYAPVKTTATSRPNFARSLPVNATRPTARTVDAHTAAVSTPGGNGLGGLSTFHSTGLISKVNRNPEDEATRIVPPDTPCKKPSHLFNTYPLPPSSAFKKKPNKANNRNSFGGIPSTPHNAPSRETPGTFGNTDKGLSIFFRGNASRNARRSSLLSLEGEDPQLPGDAADLADPMDGDVPPTPTRNTLTPSLSNVTESSIESPSAHRTGVQQLPMSAVRPPFSRESTCKSNPRAPNLSSSTDDMRRSAGRRVGLDNGQSPTLRLSFSSFGRARAKRGFSSPAPLSTTQSSALPLKSSKNVFAKISCLNSASPVEGRRTPQTPQGSLSLDTGFASISRPGETRADSSMQPPPVTPTTERDFRSSTSIYVTPVNARTTNVDIDSSLTHKFDKVEVIGRGEFSIVYRVTTVTRPSAFDVLAATPSRTQTASPAKSQIFAVKKNKTQFQGHRDRRMKLREVGVLQALREAEHVVQYVDHWEHNLHLFIQTEFCEEGTLEKFLGNVGRSARLDDFRIFKILQDLCLGLKEIHDAGFMHLDMKPANILITFEGALKIGDFGLAQPCPSTDDTEEGDREYMAPEVLERGKVNQSADIFSLGLMTLEAAANVILPDNGQAWANLRSGNLSDVPSLTWNRSSDVQRDATGNPTQSGHSDGFQDDYTHDAGNLFGSFKRSQLSQPPDFMVDPNHHSSLDQIVRWMTAQDPEHRPIPDQVLDLEGLRWVADHRTAPATVYEGNWGPIEPLPVLIASDSDTEMTDA